MAAYDTACWRRSVLNSIPSFVTCLLRDFLTLWKDANLDIPVLITAKAEYAKLK